MRGFFGVFLYPCCTTAVADGLRRTKKRKEREWTVHRKVFALTCWFLSSVNKCAPISRDRKTVVRWFFFEWLWFRKDQREKKAEIRLINASAQEKDPNCGKNPRLLWTRSDFTVKEEKCAIEKRFGVETVTSGTFFVDSLIRVQFAPASTRGIADTHAERSPGRTPPTSWR